MFESTPFKGHWPALSLHLGKLEGAIGRELDWSSKYSFWRTTLGFRVTKSQSAECVAYCTATAKARQCSIGVSSTPVVGHDAADPSVTLLGGHVGVHAGRAYSQFIRVGTKPAFVIEYIADGHPWCAALSSLVTIASH
eukprot:5148030-Amphidinium_carterae.1